MKVLLVLYCAFLCIAGFGQLKPVFTFQQDDSVVKKNYYQQALLQKNTTLNSLPKENKDDYKKIYEHRFEEIEGLLKSSRSVTSTEANNYLQSIVQKIITANPELKGMELRVVFSRDWWPNAYSMGEGTIAFNAGLFVFLSNEAELVYVLSHELAHYYLDHSGKAIKKYVETVNSEELQKELKRVVNQEYRVNEQLDKLTQNLLFDSRRHSRSNEAEADKYAYRFMKNTGYDCHAIISTLQLLNNVDDTSLFKPLQVEQVFNFATYPFKKKWIQKESVIFSDLNEEDSPLKLKEKDSLKTHPDCTKRIALLEDSINLLGNNGKTFLVNEALFRQLKKDFLAEMAEECYKEENLSRNLYNSLLLLQAGEHIPMAVYSVSRCLNTIYEKQKRHKLGLAIDAESKNFPADYNMLLRMLGKLRLDEIAAINYNFCKQYQQQMKDYAGFAEEMDMAYGFNKE